MRTFGGRTAVTFVFLTTLIFAASCGREDAEQVREPKVRPVKLITLSGASDLQTAKYPATVSAAQRSELSFQVGGLIEDIAVTESQEVKDGDVIARLDQRDFQSQVKSARSQFENAEEEFQRAVRLSREDAIARSVLEQRESQRVVARAQLDSAEKALGDTVIRAPFSKWPILLKNSVSEYVRKPAKNFVLRCAQPRALTSLRELRQEVFS